MTRSTSLRAQVRALYAERVEATTFAAAESAPSLTLPRKRGREQAVQGGGEQAAARGEAAPPATRETKLTTRARRLYENTAVPVAEIARLCGVTERTIYKYARKGGWKPRYSWSDALSNSWSNSWSDSWSDSSSAPCSDARSASRSASRLDRGGLAHRRRRAAAAAAPEGAAALDFAPVKGAGGRFVPRSERARPVARGLKATDAPGERRAAASCAGAEALAREAEAEAAFTLWNATFLLWWKTSDTIAAALAAHRARRRQREPLAALDTPDAKEQLLERLGRAACRAMEYCQMQRAGCGFLQMLEARAQRPPLPAGRGEVDVRAIAKDVG